MRAYEKLNAEIIRFEAQDVITTSVAEPCDCAKASGEHGFHYVRDGKHYYKANAFAMGAPIECTATEHVGCPVRN